MGSPEERRVPKIITSPDLPHQQRPLEQFTATLEELDTIWRKFPKHEVLMGLDANVKLAGHSGGFRVGYAGPDSDMTANDGERATCFVNFMTKNGLVAQNTWTTADAPQEEMHTR